MGRFTRDGAGFPASLDGAADQLQASIERYTRGLLRGAEARASAIADHAARSAEREASRTTAQHAARMLDAIDLLERRITESFASLKDEAETLLGRLEKADSAPRGPELKARNASTGEFDEEMAELLFLDDLPD
jgi:hypothetical protein